MSRSNARALLFLCIVAVSPARAQTAPVITPDKPLLLEEAIALAVRKNFDLQLQSYTTDQAKETLMIAQAGFDPNLTATARRNINQAASNISRLDGAQTEGPRNDNTTVSVGVNERIVTNGTVALSANVTRGATNSTNALLNPTFGNGISASISQPLLRDAGKVAARSAIDRAKLGVGIAFINYKSQVLTLISQTENAYYNLVAARETLRIRQLSLQLAQRLYDENQARRTTGVMTDLDVLSAEVGVANSRRSVIQAEQSVRDAEDTLLNLINVASFDNRPGPVQFNAYTDGAPAFAASYKLARDYYPQSLSATETLKQLQIDLETARRNRLPSLNLDASLGYTAKAVNSGYADVISNLPNEHGNNWSLGLNYSMPWGHRADKARYRQAMMNVESQKLRIDQLEQQLMVSVRTAVRSVETNLAAVEIASKATVLSEKQYEQQKARFDAGLSTSRAVLQVQDDLENTRFQELSAKVTLRRAAVELRRLEGTSIQRYGVQLPH
ncbi:MAG: TolC family protein [Opitutus sp.]|nr:TolC family protein [Opitutus sp.]